MKKVKLSQRAAIKPSLTYSVAGLYDTIRCAWFKTVIFLLLVSLLHISGLWNLHVQLIC